MRDETANLITLDCPNCGKAISISMTADATAFACPLCGEGFEIDGAAETVALPATAAPSSTPAPTHRVTQKWSSSAIMLMTVVIVMACVGIGAYVANQMPIGAPSPSGEQAEWPVATLSGHTLDGVTVRVQRVQVGPVRAKNANGTAFASDRNDYWTVHLRIRNGADKPIEYKTWHAADFPGAEPTSAIMTDGDGNRFVMQAFEDVAELQGQTVKKKLAPRESTLDVIVFEAPEGLDRSKLKELRLELPGAACEVKGVFRQIIPKTLVE